MIEIEISVIAYLTSLGPKSSTALNPEQSIPKWVRPPYSRRTCSKILSRRFE